MADINDSTPFIPDAPELPSNAPAMAASGNLGGLQAALEAHTAQPMQAQAPMGGLQSASSSSMRPFGPEAQKAYQDAIMSRIRSPGQMQSAAAERKGALQKLQEANNAPLNDWSPSQFIAQGMAENNQPWDSGAGFRSGVANAMNADLAKQANKRNVGIENAGLGQKFGNSEEAIASKEDNAAMSDAAKLFAASRLKNGGYMNVAGRGLVNLNDVDESGTPKLVIDSPKIATLVAGAMDQARKIADSKSATGELNFGTGPDAVQNKLNWIKQTAKSQVGVQLAGMGVNQSALDDMFEGNAISSQSGASKFPMQPKVAPGSVVTPLPNGGSAVTPPGVPATDKPMLDPHSLSPQAVAYLQKNYPNEYAQSVANFAQKTPEDSAIRDTNIAATQQIPGAQPAAPQVPASAAILPIGASGNIAKSGEGVVSSGTEEYKQIQEQKIAASRALQTTNDLSNLPPVDTSKFAGWKMAMGNTLDALGVGGALADKSADINKLNTMLENHVTTQMLLTNKGATGSEDVQRYRDQLASIRDPQAVYAFNVQHIRELAQRQMQQADVYNQTVMNAVSNPDPAQRQFPMMNAQAAWQKTNAELGPTFITVKGPDGKNTQYFRSKALADTLAANPGKDPAVVTEKFNAAWLKNPEKFSH